jgi:hypothetical protein
MAAESPSPEGRRIINGIIWSRVKNAIIVRNPITMNTITGRIFISLKSASGLGARLSTNTKTLIPATAQARTNISKGLNRSPGGREKNHRNKNRKKIREIRPA